MGLSIDCVGYKVPDTSWKKMKAVWDSCIAANVAVPQVVREFFSWDEPSDAGIEVPIVVDRIDSENGTRD